MQELRVFSWCDVCHAEGASVEAAEKYVITIDVTDRPGSRTIKGLDVCERHGKPVRDLVELLRQVGTGVRPKAEGDTAPAKRSSAERQAEWGNALVTCPRCGIELAQHSLRKHILARHGAKPIVQPKKCPDCGETFDTQRGMLRHRMGIHGYDHMAELAKRAKR